MPNTITEGKHAGEFIIDDDVAYSREQITVLSSTGASRKPTAGDRTIAAAVLLTPPHSTAESPSLAIPAPSSPPINACELLDGMPSHQVTMFQVIAPISAPKITCASMTLAPTMPVPTVCATCSPKNRKAMKLKNDAHSTAYCGRSTRVDTMVAIEFAASCKPFRKSKTRAIAIRAMTSGNSMLLTADPQT